MLCCAVLFLPANSLMNVTQLHERLRLELRRRIERGTLSVSLLGHKATMSQGSISNFLSGRRGLSPMALDKILKAEQLTLVDLMPERREAWGGLLDGQLGERRRATFS